MGWDERMDRDDEMMQAGPCTVVVAVVVVVGDAADARARPKVHFGAIIISTNIISHPGGADKHTKQTLFSLFLSPLSSRMDN